MSLSSPQFLPGTARQPSCLGRKFFTSAVCLFTIIYLATAGLSCGMQNQFPDQWIKLLLLGWGGLNHWTIGSLLTMVFENLCYRQLRLMSSSFGPWTIALLESTLSMKPPAKEACWVVCMSFSRGSSAEVDPGLLLGEKFFTTLPIWRLPFVF